VGWLECFGLYGEHAAKAAGLGAAALSWNPSEAVGKAQSQHQLQLWPNPRCIYIS